MPHQGVAPPGTVQHIFNVAGTEGEVPDGSLFVFSTAHGGAFSRSDRATRNDRNRFAVRFCGQQGNRCEEYGDEGAFHGRRLDGAPFCRDCPIERRDAGSDPPPRGTRSANRSTTVIIGARPNHNHGYSALRSYCVGRCAPELLLSDGANVGDIGMIAA